MSQLNHIPWGQCSNRSFWDVYSANEAFKTPIEHLAASYKSGMPTTHTDHYGMSTIWIQSSFSLFLLKKEKDRERTTSLEGSTWPPFSLVRPSGPHKIALWKSISKHHEQQSHLKTDLWEVSRWRNLRTHPSIIRYVLVPWPTVSSLRSMALTCWTVEKGSSQRVSSSPGPMASIRLFQSMAILPEYGAQSTICADVLRTL
jgi:hypothetical protein